MLAPRSGAYAPDRIGPAEVVERYGVRPEQVPDFIALRGDPSDRLPGARGIGAKGAAELLGRYPDLAAIVAHADELRPRQAEAVRDADLPLFKRIAAMDREAPAAPPPDATLDRDGAIAYLEAIGDDRLAIRLQHQ
ncbi:MAG TPA: 5'-3' exonuclease H3TH domain-containing protein [Gaiellales bacterium]